MQVEVGKGCCRHVLYFSRHVDGSSSSTCTPDVSRLVQRQVSLIVLLVKILTSFCRGAQHLSVDALDLVYRFFMHGFLLVPLLNNLFADAPTE